MIFDRTHTPLRNRWQFTLRALLLAVLPIALALGLWQTRRLWQAAHFVRVETSGGSQWTSEGQLDYDLVVKLRCSREFTCQIEHEKELKGIVESPNSVNVVQSRPIGPRFSNRHSVELRIVYHDGIVSVFPSSTGTENPVFCQSVIAKDQRLRSSCATGPYHSRRMPFGAPLRALCVAAWYDDGLVSDTLVLRARRSKK